MKNSAVTILWACAVSMLLSGCYSSSLVAVDPAKGTQAYHDLKGINGVVTREGTEYALSDAYVRNRRDVGDSAAATAAVDSLIGDSKGERIALPLSDITQVSVQKFDPTVGIVVVGSAAIVGGVIVLVEAAREFSHFDRSFGWHE